MSEQVSMRSARVQQILAHKKAERANAQKAREREASWARLKEQKAGFSYEPLSFAQSPEGRELSRVLPDGSWRGQRCFIVGGGPSLKDFDFSRLKGERVIGINRAFESCECDILFAMDARLYDWITKGTLGERSRARFSAYAGLKVWVSDSVPGVHLLKNHGAAGLTESLVDGVATGNNSGYAALNLAMCLGANPIYLLGFDMAGDGNGKQAWFHDGYPENQGDKVYKMFVDQFSLVADEIKRRGFRVVNLNPNSGLKSFEFGDFDKVLPEKQGAICLNGCLGFGDNFQQRPLVRELAKRHDKVYVKTAFPEAYWDMPDVKPVEPGPMNLAAQNKHVASQPDGAYLREPPFGTPCRSWREYWPTQTAGQPGISNSRHIHAHFGDGAPYDFSFPVKSEWLMAARRVIAGLNIGRKKLCVIRRPMQRTEFNCPSRNPKPEYFQLLMDRYRSEYFYLSLADMVDGREWPDGELTGIDAAFEHGELPLTTVMGLVKLADMTITTPGLFLPMAIALRARAFGIFGGHTDPAVHIDPIQGLQTVAYVAPDPFCRCLSNLHECRKDIPEDKLVAAFEELKNRKPEVAGQRWESLNRIATGRPPVADNEKPKIKEAVFFRGCYGIGDNLNQRPVVRDLAEKYEAVYLQTTVPEFYWDIPNVRFVFPDGVAVEHRTHSKHVFGLPAETFVEKPVGAREMVWHHKLQRIVQDDGQLHYYVEDDKGEAHEVEAPNEQVSICEDIRRRAGIEKPKYDYSLPVKREWIAEARKVLAGLDTGGKKICVVNPPTTRAEWPCVARNPKIEHFNTLIEARKGEYFFISIADLEDGQESIDGELVGADATFHHGELSLTTIIGLLKIADLALVAPAWMLNIGIAVRAKVFAIFGGHAGPEYLIDPIMGIDNVEWAAPEPFCNCWRMEHDCNKEIEHSGLIAKFDDFGARPRKLKVVTMGFPPGIGDVYWPALILESFKERHGIDRLVIRFREEWNYTSAFLKSLPFVDAVETHKTPLPFSFSLAGGHGRPLYVSKGGVDYMIDYGSSLERGVMLEDVMPDYEVNWHFGMTGLEEYDQYVADLRAKCGGRLVVIYTANKGGNQHWASSDWTVKDWMELVRLIHAENGCRVALVGMQFDHSYAVDLKALDKDDLIIDLTGQTPIMQTLAIIKAADLFIGFSCGLDMLACHFHTPCAEFWPIKGISKGGVYNPAFMTTWLPPWMRNSDDYIPIPYGPESRPELVFPRIRKFLK